MMVVAVAAAVVACGKTGGSGHAADEATKSSPGAQAFFTMMATVARRPALGGVQLKREDAHDTAPVHRAFWIDYPKRGWTDQTLPTPGAAIAYKGYMLRCVAGVEYRYGVPGIVDGPDLGKWVREGRNPDDCDLKNAIGGMPPIDGILTGGLTSARAADWVDELAGTKDPDADKPLFTFSATRTAVVNGQPTVVVDVSITPSPKRSSQGGLGYLLLDLFKLTGTNFPYNTPGASIDGFQATYWINAVNHLPVKSVGHVVLAPVMNGGIPGTGWSFQTTYQFSRQPDWKHLPVK